MLGTKPISGFRAALRDAFAAPSSNTEFRAHMATDVSDGPEALPPWQGLAGTPCASWDNMPGDFDVVCTRALHNVLGCLDRGIYVKSPGLYCSHLAWIVRRFYPIVAAGRDTLAIGRCYVANRLT